MANEFIARNGLIAQNNSTVTGSLTVTAGITGSFSGSGADLSGIPASGITGLNLSQISSGSVSASISPTAGLEINTNVTAISFTGSLFGTSSFSISSSISTSSSYSDTSTSASYALTASYALNGGGGGGTSLGIVQAFSVGLQNIF